MSEKGNGKAFWRSLDELADTPEFREMVKNEFPSRLPKLLSSVSRRGFLKVMGASMALMGLAGCRWPEEEIVPFANRPRNTDPGVPKTFATSMELWGFGVPLLATSYDGRPVKVDGNPDHPMSFGGSTAIVQASLLDLYDPDRSTHPVRRDGGTERAATLKDLVAAIGPGKLGRGRGLRVLAEPSHSPTRERLRKAFERRYPEAVWHEYSPFPAVPPGVDRAIPILDRAEVIASLDDDLLYDHPASVVNTKHWAAGRRAEDGRMNRLWVVESGYSVTGGAADHRLAVRPSRIPRVAAALLAVVSGKPPGDLPEAGFVRRMAADLAARRGRSLVTAGPGQPAAVHEIARLVNEKLGNLGRTVTYASEPPAESLADLAAALNAGAVSTLLLLGGNPVFDAPADLDFASALARARVSIHLSDRLDETSAVATWHVNRAHYLESWDDCRALDATPAVIQPLIRPLYGGLTAPELLARFLPGEPEKGHDLVRATWKSRYLSGPDFETRWRRVLNDGFLRDGPRPAHPMRPRDPWTEEALADAASRVPEGEREVVFRADPTLYDGRFANNAWLMEMPDPLTKLTWDNAALVSPGDAAELSLKSGDHVRIAVGDRSIEIPVWILPGQPKGSISLPAGNGRKRAGRVAEGHGFDVYPLRASGAPGFAAATVEKVPGRTRLACTHNHHAIDSVGESEAKKRMHRLIREATLDEYRAHPDFAKEAVHVPAPAPIFREQEYGGHRWAMSIDLSACTGCSACLVACQAENNVPVVGKEEVLVNREMHWLRIDRYFGGGPEDATVRHQPVPCMQCENAPCEQVCPVAATMHSEDGLNDMVYNRCVGTRYCSNNCPYKVRRFNWRKNHDGLTDIQKMVFNPEVTVRSRGVMEKCTYCVQRIRAATTTARTEDREVADGEITPACAQACPADAIVFGDLADPESRVAKLHASERSYGLLEELNTKPRTRYLARLTNPAGDE